MQDRAGAVRDSAVGLAFITIVFTGKGGPLYCIIDGMELSLTNIISAAGCWERNSELHERYHELQVSLFKPGITRIFNK